MSYVTFDWRGGSECDGTGVCEDGKGGNGAEAGFGVDVGAGIDVGAATGGDLSCPFDVLGGPSIGPEGTRECDAIGGLGPYEGD